MRHAVPINTDLSLNLGASLLEKALEVAQGRVGGRQGCNAIACLLTSRGTRANLRGAVKHCGRGGDRLAGWENHLEAGFCWVGGFHLDAVESLPLQRSIPLSSACARAVRLVGGSEHAWEL